MRHSWILQLGEVHLARPRIRKGRVLNGEQAAQILRGCHFFDDNRQSFNWTSLTWADLIGFRRWLRSLGCGLTRDFRVWPSNVQRLDFCWVDRVAGARSSRRHSRDDRSQRQLLERRNLSRHGGCERNRAIAHQNIGHMPGGLPSCQRRCRIADRRALDFDQAVGIERRSTRRFEQRAEDIAAMRIHPCANRASGRFFTARRGRERHERRDREPPACC